GVEEGGEELSGLGGGGVGEAVDRLVDEGDQVVGAVGERRVVERSALLRNPLDNPVQVGHDVLGQPPQVRRGGHTERHAGPQTPQVHLGAGEGHRGGQSERAGPGDHGGGGGAQGRGAGRVRSGPSRGGGAAVCGGR